MKFQAMHLEGAVLQNIETLGYTRPTDIQYKAIPPALDGQDVMAIAQTGTGKTAAFTIPSICNLMRTRPAFRYEGVRCIIMEPTHELAAQVTDVVRKLAYHTKVRVAAIYGGMSQDDQINTLRKGADIIVATPGRLFDLCSQGHLVIDRAEILVVDEADQMLALGFYDDIRQLVRRLPRHRQTLFFSATIDAHIKELAYSLVYKAVRIEMSRNKVAKNVTHQVIGVSMDEKRFYLERIAKENAGARIMVFVRTKVRAERVAAAMKRAEVNSTVLHGGLEQKERHKALEEFRTGAVPMIITTDVAARGIDIPSVNYVVNYDVPEVPENYIHRVGRTGRGMDKGYALTFCAPEERETLKAVEDYLGESISLLKMDGADRKATVDLAQENASDWRSLINDD